jgi:hypothetical protein
MKNKTRSFYLPIAVPPAVRRMPKYPAVVLAALGLSNAAPAADIMIHLKENASISRKTVRYQCDAQAAKIGLPSGPFPVE